MRWIVMKYKLEYDHNNSGGHWWLKDKDWKNLEKAGWKVDWYKNRNKKLSTDMEYPEGRFLGALAGNASIETNDPKEEIHQWERITGQTASDKGCSCCGPPHSFSWTDEKGVTHWYDDLY